MRRRSAIFFITVLLALSGCGVNSPARTSGTESDTTVSPKEDWKTLGNGAALETTDSGRESSQELPPACEEPEKPLLTRQKVVELAGKKDLTWGDFQDYGCEDIGFGLMIRAYRIDRDFSLFIGGAGPEAEPMYIRVGALGDEEAYLDLRESSAGQAEEFFERYSSRAEYVGIRGHIKEVREDAALISSDTHEFPGAFWVTGVHQLAGEEELKGGTSVFVLMEDTGEREADGLERFTGRQLLAIPQEEDNGKADILLTSPPPMMLQDALSSRYEPFEIRPGNCTWGVMEGEETREWVACGAAPLDDMMLKDRARLKLPVYNKIDQVSYSLSTVIKPDRLVIRQWRAGDIGETEAREESVTTLYYVIPLIRLEKDKVYELVAEWGRENLESNGFWGNASYVVMTE